MMRTYDIAQDRDRFVYASSALHAVVIISRHRMEAQEEPFGALVTFLSGTIVHSPYFKP